MDDDTRKHIDQMRAEDDARAPKTTPEAMLIDWIRHLVRLGVEGKTEDVRMLGRRIIRRVRGSHPELSKALTELLPNRIEDILR